MRDLVLYYRPTCPYCLKVLRFMREQGIELMMRDIASDPSAKEELVRVGGKNQVPCLFVDGGPLYESDDIIAFLGREYAGSNS